MEAAKVLYGSVSKGFRGSVVFRGSDGFRGAYFIIFFVTICLLVFKYTPKFEELFKKKKHPQPKSS